MRRKKPTLSEEGLQQLEQEINTASAHAILQNNELTNDVQRLRTRRYHDELDAYSIVSEYSEIVKRSLEINKEVFQMALNIKDDLKELLYGRIDELKGGRNKGWFVALSMTLSLLFTLIWILWGQWISSIVSVPMP